MYLWLSGRWSVGKWMTIGMKSLRESKGLESITECMLCVFVVRPKVLDDQLFTPDWDGVVWDENKSIGREHMTHLRGEMR